MSPLELGNRGKTFVDFTIAYRDAAALRRLTLSMAGDLKCSEKTISNRDEARPNFCCRIKPVYPRADCGISRL